MMRRVGGAAGALSLWLLVACVAVAQTDRPDAQDLVSDELIGPPAPPDVDPLAPGDYSLEAWTSLATRAEAALRDSRASEFALARLRTSIVEWRDVFLEVENENAPRIATVTAQLAALGAAPEGDGGEDARVTARRAALQAQLVELQAPQALAQEAFARASGLTSEIDSALRELRAGALFARARSPLNMDLWPQAMTEVRGRVDTLLREPRTAFASAARQEAFRQNLPQVLLPFALGLLLLLRGPRWSRVLSARVANSQARSKGAWRLLLSIAQFAAPIAGLVALREALLNSGFFGFNTGPVVSSIVPAGGSVFLAHWLAAQFFAPERARSATMEYAAGDCSRIRRYLEALGWLGAANEVLRAALTAPEVSEYTVTLASMPIYLGVCFVLFRLGTFFARTKPKPEVVEKAVHRGLVLPTIGRLMVLVAAVGPVLIILGFQFAWYAMTTSTVLTLALMGVVVVLQRLAFEVYLLFVGEHRRGEDALFPVLSGFVMVLLSLPVLALIWGARVEELGELWSRFREGYTWGETRISPADFVTFALVFGVGYMMTRMVQGVMRTSILPRTRLDKGAQNAIVAGLGYVGIFAATIVAITSAGINLSSLAIVAGALSVGIGFGLQNIVSNFVSGIILLIERPISEGDWIEVGTQMGYVRSISVRSTRIETFDRTDVIIPNSDLISGSVINWTRNNSIGRVKVPVGVAYGSDTAEVSAILREVAESHASVLLQPPPNVLFLGFGADSMDFEIRAILSDVNNVLNVTSDMNHAIAAKFAEKGIEIPFAQRDIWLRNPEALAARGPNQAPPAEFDMEADDDNAVHKAEKPGN